MLLSGDRWVRRTIAIALFLLLVFPFSAGNGAEADPTTAAQAVRRFGEALIDAEPAPLKRLLPRRGKVQLRLVHLGSGDGFFSAGQVEALFRDFLAAGTVHSFRPLGVEQAARGVALVRARVDLTTREGTRTSVEIHLALQPEDGRWVLREIRETPS